MQRKTDGVGTETRDVSDLGLYEAAMQTGYELEPGDIIVAKTLSNPLSRAIGALDGWWCHTAIYVGDGRVAHSNSQGVTLATLEFLHTNYEAGIGAVRPACDRDQRDAAAAWAKEVARGMSSYASPDLGTAFSLLWRAFLQPSAAELHDLLHNDEFLSAGSETWSETYEATCSGFAYQAYTDGAGAPLEIVPAPGIRLEDGMLYVPSREELLAELRASSSGEGGEMLGFSRRLAEIGFVGAIHAAKALLVDKPIPIRTGVTPADIWMSPTGHARWFISGAEEALAALSEHRDAE